MQPDVQVRCVETHPTVLQTIAFVNPDNSGVAVVCNPSDAPLTFNIDVSGDARACEVPARAIQTYVVRGGA